MMETTASFGYLVRRRRKALDTTQAELAQRLGCSLATIRKIESDSRRPSRQMAGLLADGLLSELLQWSAGVKILATSRERLNLQGEWVFEIRGLPVPASARDEDLAHNSCVRLFLQSAGRLQPYLQPNSHNADSIVRICRFVEGMPLAIELAATWVRTLSIAEIAHEIESNLDFLAASTRDMPERQRSLHELVRQYALKQLQAIPGRYHETVCRHSVYYLNLLENSLPHLLSRRQQETLRALTVESDNIRAAWEWMLEQGEFAALGRAALSLLFYCEFSNLNFEGERLLRRTLDRFEADRIAGSVPDQADAVLWGTLLAHISPYPQCIKS